MVDLHSHSTASDGTLSPTELLHYANSRDVSVLALTDHDTTAGLAEAKVAAAELGLTFIPGIELEIDFEPGTFHLLGLGIHRYSSERLADVSRASIAYRRERNEKIAKKMNQAGISGNYDDVVKLAGHEVVGRPHFARYLVQKGWAADIEDAFGRFLGQGKPLYAPRCGISLVDALDAIHDAGGLAYVAHPLSLRKNWTAVEQLLEEWKELGLDGIETFHSGMSFKQGKRFATIATRLGLFQSGGSDFHSPEDEHRKLGRTCLEGRKVPPELADRLQASGN